MNTLESFLKTCFLRHTKGSQRTTDYKIRGIRFLDDDIHGLQQTMNTLNPNNGIDLLIDTG